MVFAFAEVPAKPLNEGDVLALVAIKQHPVW
jgi:hypothetical protein